MRDSSKHKGLRKRLVDQLVLKGIKSKIVIDALLKVPRHLFIDQDFETHAYIDKAFPIDSEQTISQPFTVAFQTSLLNLNKKDKIKNLKVNEIININKVNPCIILTLYSNSSLSVMNQVTRESKAANSSNGPARPPQTAEIRYNNGRSAPPYSVTNFNEEKSNMKANTRSKNGDTCAIDANVFVRLFPAFWYLNI